MRYSDQALTEQQKKNSDKIINILMKGFDLVTPPDTNIKGLYFYEDILQLEMEREGKDPKEVKRINKKIKNLEFAFGDKIKVTFNFDNHLYKLVFMNQTMPTRRYSIPQYLWTGILDFPIKESFIFGRVAKRQRHGGGKFVFAPLDISVFRDIVNIDQVIEKIALVSEDVVDANPFIELLDKIRFSKQCFDQMKLMLEKIKSKQGTGNALVDDFNGDKDLLSAVSSIRHFGHAVDLNIKFQSEVDVSIICFPSGGRTFLQVCTFSFGNKKTCSAIKILAKTLEREHFK